MNIGTGEPARTIARFANGRAESTFSVSEIVSPVMDVNPNAEPPAHTKRMLVVSQSVVAAGAAPQCAYIVIPPDLNLTIVCRRTSAFTVQSVAGVPTALSLVREYAAPGARPSGFGGILPIDGIQELIGGSSAYGVIPVKTGTINNAGLGGGVLYQASTFRSSSGNQTFTNICDYPFVLPSQRRIQQDLVFGWTTNGNVTSSDILVVNFYLDWYSRWFDPTS